MAALLMKRMAPVALRLPRNWRRKMAERAAAQYLNFQPKIHSASGRRKATARKRGKWTREGLLRMYPLVPGTSWRRTRVRAGARVRLR